LDEVLHIDIDGFAYASAYEDDRYVGLTVKAPTDVRNGGLIVDPKAARAQIAKDTAAAEAANAEANAVTADQTDDAQTTSAFTSMTTASSNGGGGGVAATAAPATRFHATRELTSNRVVRDVGQIYEEIVAHFVTAGVAVTVTLDVESDQLDRLTDDQ